MRGLAELEDAYFTSFVAGVVIETMLGAKFPDELVEIGQLVADLIIGHSLSRERDLELFGTFCKQVNVF